MKPASLATAPSVLDTHTSSQSWLPATAPSSASRARTYAPRPIEQRADGQRLGATGGGEAGGVDAVGGDQRRRLGRERVGLVRVLRRLGLGQELAHLDQQRLVDRHWPVRPASGRRTVATSGQVVGQRPELLQRVVEHGRILDHRARRRQDVIDALRRRPAPPIAGASSSSPRRHRHGPAARRRSTRPPTSSAWAPRRGWSLRSPTTSGAGTCRPARSISRRGLDPARLVVVVRREVDVEHPHDDGARVDRDVDADPAPPRPDRPAADPERARRRRCGAASAPPGPRRGG